MALVFNKLFNLLFHLRSTCIGYKYQTVYQLDIPPGPFSLRSSHCFIISSSGEHILFGPVGPTIKFMWLRRGIPQVHVPCGWSCVLMQPIITKLGSLVDIGVANDLTFSDFWFEVSEPVGSEQSELCSVISQRLGLLSAITCNFTYFGGSVEI